VLAVLANGARATYHFSGATPFGQTASIHLFGSDGVLAYDLLTDRIRGASRRNGASSAKLADLEEIPIPAERARAWSVEADFIAAIRHGRAIEFTTIEAGVAYMEFTEAVARSAETGEAVALPLQEFVAEQ
jgi:predicted dehydrogenase